MTSTRLAAALLLALASAAADVAAQAPKPDGPDVAAIRQAAATDKRGLVERNMKLTPEEAKKFWPIYDDYQRELDKIVKRQNRAVLDYVQEEDSLTDGNAKRIAREVMTADADELKLRERLAKKLVAVLPPRKALRCLQIENKLRALHRYDLAERISLVR